MTEITTINLFYPLLFLTIIVLIVTVGIVFKAIKSDFTFKDIFFKNSTDNKEIFFKHTEEHTDTTSKMAQMHDNVIPLKYTSIQEKELHTIEVGLKSLKDNVDEINAKVDELIKRVIILEEHK